MKKIGFIDYYLDEWHAENYPGWIEEATAGKMKVSYAYALRDAPHGLSNQEWCQKQGIQLLSSIKEVVDRSDYLLVLAPDHPQFHEELAQLPLQSGKPTYIDKTFAPDRRTAIRLFERANQYGTPLYSSSALRFAEEYVQADREEIDLICSHGPGQYGNYAIHQVEPIIALMGARPERVMYIGTATSPALLIGFADGRQASIHHIKGTSPFRLLINYQSGRSAILQPESDFFVSFIQNLTSFFESGQSTVDPQETIAVITVLEYGLKAAEKPYHWVSLPEQ